MSVFPPTSVLAAVDFGEASGHAVRMAGAFAARFGARLVGVHAESLEAPPYFTHDQIEALKRQQMEARSRAARYLVQFAAKVTRVPLEPVIGNGPAADAILDAAARHDLLVMGTHGRRGASRWWLGSVAERVVRSTPIPVMVVRATDMDHDPSDHFRRILLVGDERSTERAVERYAGQLTESCGGQIVQRMTRCNEAMAVRREASLVAIGVAGSSGERLSDTAEQLIRACPMPILFVPD